MLSSLRHTRLRTPIVPLAANGRRGLLRFPRHTLASNSTKSQPSLPSSANTSQEPSSRNAASFVEYKEQAKRLGEPRITLPPSDFYDLVPFVEEDGTVDGVYYKPNAAICPEDTNWVTWDWVNTYGLFHKDHADINLSFGNYFNLVPLMCNQSERNWIMRRDNGQFWNVDDEDGEGYSLCRIHEPRGEEFLKMLADYYKQDPPYDFWPWWKCLLGEEVTSSNFRDYLRREQEGKTKPVTGYGSPPAFYSVHGTK